MSESKAELQKKIDELEKNQKDNQLLEAENAKLKEALAAVSPEENSAPVKVELPSEVAQKYELVNWTGGHKQLFGRHGIIDITKLTIERAASLVKQGWPKLREKK